MRQTLILYYIPTDLNTYINQERTHRMIAARTKKEETESVRLASLVADLKPMKSPVVLNFTWYYKSKHDLDNISFAKKYILDGLVKARVLQNDSKKDVIGFKDDYVNDTVDQVIIDIIEVKGNATRGGETK